MNKKIIIPLVIVIVLILIYVVFIQQKLSFGSNLIAKDTNPYPPATDMIIGNSAYFLVKKPMDQSNTLYYFDIYSDPSTGNIRDKSGKIFYHPVEKDTTVVFGVEASGDIETFRNDLNQEISTQGYAIVSFFWNAGPSSDSYIVIKN